MNRFKNCLLACDVDDTLMSNGVIPARNLKQIERFIAEGGCFSLATGRSAAALSSVRESLKSISPSVLGNGSLIYDFTNRKILEQTVIEPQEHRVVRCMMESGFPLGIEVHCGDHIYILLDHQELRDHEEYEKYTAETVSFEEVDGYDWNKALYLFRNEEDREQGKKRIHALSPTSSFSDTSAVIGNRRRFYYEQFPCGISKATGVKRLAEILKIKPGGLFVMGDYYNDIQMMEKADISGTTGGAPEDIKRLADFVGGSCEDGAVADFINYLFKTRKD